MFRQHLRRAVLSSVVAAAPALAQPYDPGDDVFYHVMPISWRDSDNDQYRYGDFNGMSASLDYLQSLGITGVWMNPIHPSPAYHGYQHDRIDQVNPWFGTEAQFLNFVAQAKARGIKVYIDVVCYGVSQNSTYFQSAHNNPASPYDSWLAFTNAGNSQFTGYSFTTWTGATVGFVNWDLRSPPDGSGAAESQVITWCKKWLDPNNDGNPSDGIAGYRLDHVWAQYNQGPDGWGYNTDDFWVPWKTALQTVNPQVFTFAEQADWGSHGADLLPAQDATFTKPFEFAARDALKNESAANLYSSMAATVAALPTNLPAKTFLCIIGDHDVDRLASNIGADSVPGRAKAAAAIHLLQPFPPIIYYGDELGMRGTKGNWGSDANDIPMREPMKWNAVNSGTPMTNYWVRNSQAYNNRFSQNNDGRSVQEQQGLNGSLLEHYKALIALRKNNAALRRGSYHPVPATGGKTWSFVRHHTPQSGQSQTLLVAINVSGQSQNASLDFSTFTLPQGGSAVSDLITGQQLAQLTDVNKAAYPLTVPAYAHRVLSVSVSPPAPPVNEVDGRDIKLNLGLPGDGAGTLLATQSCATSFGDNTSELDQLYARADSRGIHLGLTGNLATNGTALALFFDSSTGGQNIVDTSALSPPPGGLDLLTGTRFDAGFSPDDLLFINTSGGSIFVDHAYLPTSGPATKNYRGRGTVNDGDGLLSGNNPNGLQVAMDNTNTAGVTASSAANAGSATTGFELFIPYSEFGIATPIQTCLTIALAAFIVRSDGTQGNQVLPPVPAGSPDLGLAPDFTTKSGNQFTVFVLPNPADFNGDGFVDGIDYDSFMTAFESGDPAADFNGDTFVDGIDYDSFVNLFESGC